MENTKPLKPLLPPIPPNSVVVMTDNFGPILATYHSSGGKELWLCNLRKGKGYGWVTMRIATEEDKEFLKRQGVILIEPIMGIEPKIRATSFLIDGEEHIIGEECDCKPTRCIVEGCVGYVHFQPIYGGITYKCDICGAGKYGE